MADELFFIGTYGVKLSDLIASAALVISGYSALSSARSSRAATRSSTIAARNFEREQNKDAQRKEVRIQTFVHHDDNEGPGPQRHLKLQLRAPENGDFCEFTECELVHPSSAILELRYSGKVVSSRSADGTRKSKIMLQPAITLNENPAMIGATFHVLAFDRRPTVFTLKGVRLDATRTPITTTIETPAYKFGG